MIASIFHKSLQEREVEVKNLEENKYDPIEITPEHDESAISIKPEFQCHVSQNENSLEAIPEMNSPMESIKDEHRSEFITVKVEEAVYGSEIDEGKQRKQNNEVSHT